ncbi:hypothetical protein TGRH88_065120 [Toxoplasma gondii]|uniref:Uncharacterized protein n=1 Tax=Toxoplasma gondii TaxID=5811 RepID=A0A7J6JUN5_TOXGO|nr:hypothetical protein TGRH88_065120 [Toxoplasma gondii]
MDSGLAVGVEAADSAKSEWAPVRGDSLGTRRTATKMHVVVDTKEASKTNPISRTYFPSKGIFESLKRLVKNAKHVVRCTSGGLLSQSLRGKVNGDSPVTGF